MTPEQARDYLETAVQTETGQQALGLLGLSPIIDDPRGGDDRSSVQAAEAVRNLLHRQYPSMF